MNTSISNVLTPDAAGVEVTCSSPSDENSAEELAASIHSENSIPCWLLEAWILTGVDHQTVAKKVGVDPKVVEAYESAYLDLKDRRSATDFVSVTIAQLQRGDRPVHVEFIQRSAFFGGPLVLEGFLDAIGGPQGLSGQILPKFDLTSQRGRLLASTQLAIALNVIPPGGLNAEAILQLLRWKQSRDNKLEDDGDFRELAKALAKVFPGKPRPQTVAKLLRDLLASEPNAIARRMRQSGVNREREPRSGP